MSEPDEFAEFDMDEATFDAILDRGEPAMLVPVPVRLQLSGPATFKITDNVARPYHGMLTRPTSTAFELEGSA